MSEWKEEYRVAMRDFMTKNGKKVLFREKRYEWDRDDEVSNFGWQDLDAWEHTFPKDSPYPRAGGCHWIVPEGAVMYERSYSQFVGTFAGNDDEIGINVTGCRCACGKYTDVTLRYVGTLSDVLHSILGIPDEPEVRL